MFKNALISVSNKSGLLNFLSPYAKNGLRILSTGGTAQYLKENGLTVHDVSEQTGFPEVMGGRVKTLHPRIHMSLLARSSEPEDLNLLKSQGLEPFDLLICNLYPFEEAVLAGKSGKDLIEKIDVGGPSMLRAAAKNFERITVVCDPDDYEWVLAKKSLDLEDRQYLAAKVFSHISVYDSMIAKHLNPKKELKEKKMSYGGNLVRELRYGENPQQKAAWYSWPGDKQGLHQAEIIQGKELSYNNLLDLDAAINLLKEFNQPAVVAVKHNNPCGVAIDQDISIAFSKALQSDPVSIFGGIIALNRKIEASLAEKMSEIFLECIIAPDISSEALQIFSRKKNLRILKWPEILEKSNLPEIKSISGGFLVQDKDQLSDQTGHWKTVSGTLDHGKISDLLFAEKVCAALKSNAIAIVKDGQTLGLGMGQVNRVDSVKHAVERMRKNFPQARQVVLASDAFFPFPDSIEMAAEAGISWILQPGGSVKDSEVIDKANSLNIAMIFTGQRHFKH
jgi:phosphoribosylaminoimidazolecarboxamide formyltransferase/IMP cyclohydrolase